MSTDLAAIWLADRWVRWWYRLPLLSWLAEDLGKTYRDRGFDLLSFRQESDVNSGRRSDVSCRSTPMPSFFSAVRRQTFKLWRKRRFGLFVRIVRPSLQDLLLDVGGYPSFWAEQPRIVRRVDTLNIHQLPWSPEEAPEQPIESLLGDGCALSMGARSYDIGFSNSVLEHVGSWERQQQFAAEIRRVAKALWVQTPAYECPIEPHYLMPFVHFLPRSLQKKVLRWGTPWGWLERPSRALVDEWVDITRLVSKREMTQLFPDCEILTERLLGIIPKSYVAVRRKSEPTS